MLATFCRDCGLESASAYETIGYAGILPLGSICRNAGFTRLNCGKTFWTAEICNMLATFCRDCGLESASAYEAIGYAGILPLGSICRKCLFHGTLIDLRRAFPTVFSTVLVDTIAGLSPVVRLSIYSLDAALVPGRQAASEGFRNFGFD